MLRHVYGVLCAMLEFPSIHGSEHLHGVHLRLLLEATGEFLLGQKRRTLRGLMIGFLPARQKAQQGAKWSVSPWFLLTSL